MQDKYDTIFPSDKREDYDKRWEAYWNHGIPEGTFFDMGAPHKALSQMLQDKEIETKGKRAVVPGCGRGHDAVLLAKEGAIVDGLEIAQSAVAEANTYLKKYNEQNGLALEVNYYAVDFFDYKDKYEIGFDYTFLCAIHPDDRPKWAQKWAELIQPGGKLIVFPYPINQRLRRNPPWVVTVEDVSSILNTFFQCNVDEAIPHDLSIERRAGYERKMIWTRK